MKLKSVISCIGLSVKSEVGKDNNHFYKISVDQDGEAGTLPMSEDAFKSIENSFKKYSPTQLTVEYNDQYKSMRVIGVSQGVR